MENNNFNFTNEVGGFVKKTEPKKPVLADTRDLVFAILSVVTALVAVSFGLFGGFKVGFTISYIMFFTTSTAYLLKKGTKIELFPLTAGILALLSSFVFTFNVDGLINYFLLMFIAVLSFIYVVNISGTSFKTGEMGVVSKVLDKGLGGMFEKISAPFISFFSKESGFAKGSKVKGIFLGILAAIPAVFIIIPLLISADAAFEGLIESIFKDFFLTIFKLILGLCIAPFIFSLLFSLRKNLSSEKERKIGLNVSNVTINTFLIIISICYLTYLFSQLAYFISAFSGVLPKDYIAAENVFAVVDYAKRGFFEIAAISAINLVIVFFSFFVCKDGEKRSVVKNILGAFIVLFTLFLLSCSVMKMVLYINQFGLTRLRVLTMCIMLLIFICFIFVTIKLVFAKFSFIKSVVVGASIVFLLIGFVDVDRIVAFYNFNAYKTGMLESIDVATIARLSDASTEYLIELAKDKDPSVSSIAKTKLAARFDDHYYYDRDTLSYQLYESDKAIESFNITRARSIRLLYENRALFVDKLYDHIT